VDDTYVYLSWKIEMKCLLVCEVQTIYVCHSFEGKMDKTACVNIVISIGIKGISSGFQIELIILIHILS
jgi:hypothetical protein